MQSESGSSVKNRMLKAEVHCFYRNGSWYALDVRRMRVFINLSPLEAEILALSDREIAMMKLNQQFVQTLSNLEEKGLLRYTQQEQPPPVRDVSSEIDTLELNIAQDCNLRCKYCFLEQGYNSSGGWKARKNVTGGCGSGC